MQRTCKVTVTEPEGTTHTTTVMAGTEAAAAAIEIFRKEHWAADALTPNAILRIEVQLPPVIHEVPLKAVERWAKGPSGSPSEMIAQRRFVGGKANRPQRGD